MAGCFSEYEVSAIYANRKSIYKGPSEGFKFYFVSGIWYVVITISTNSL